MSMQYKHKWNKETGMSICTIEYNGFKFYGYSQCSPEDKDFKSEMIGGNLATWRAEIAYLKHVKRCEIEPRIQAYYHLAGTMHHSKQHNPNSYEAKRLYQEYKNAMDDLDEINNEITETNKMIQEYCQQLDKIHNKVKN